MQEKVIRLLLADDDEDDCIFFQEALAEIPINTTLNMVNDGESLMRVVNNCASDFPDIIFLDLNMPRKNGIECLTELKLNEAAKHIPVVIISTSHDEEVVKQLFEIGAYHYISKPAEFPALRSMIHSTLSSLEGKL